MRIAVDAFGGDNAPLEIVKGAISALEKLPEDEIILVGKENEIQAILAAENVTSDRLLVRHADEVIGTGEHPVEAIRAKKNSSLMVALSMVKSGEADVVVSAGNTGAYLAGAFRSVGRIKGIKRPALTTVIPTEGAARGILLDVGANADCRPEHLVQFGQMGSIYASHILGIDNPRVALLNIGAEEAKGNALTKETHQLLKEQDNINFIGNIEPRDVLSGKADVIVCDGFTGNVVIKLIEGTAMTMFSMLKKAFYKSFMTKLAAAVLKPGLKVIKSKLDYTEYGGVPLLGINGVVFKAHGSSNSLAFANAICSARDYAAAGINEQIKALVEANGLEETEE